MLGIAFVIVCAGGAPDDRKEAGASRHEHKYETLTDDEIKHLLFDCKWMPRLYGDINSEIERILNDYASRVIMIAKRYEHTLGEIEDKTAKSKEDVRQALERMGYIW